MKNVAFILGLLAVQYVALSQKVIRTDYPFLHRVLVNGQARLTSDGIHEYTYSLFNEPINKGNIWVFEIDISLGRDAIRLDTVGLRFHSSFEERLFRRNYPPRAQSIVPVGFPFLPELWTGGFSNNLTASFGTHKMLPSPGQKVTGITMTSKGLPGIRAFIVKPDFDEVLYLPSLEDSTRTMTIVQMDSIREIINFHGKTVGPVAPRLHFDGGEWLDTLLSYTRQSTELGWLGKDPKGAGRDNDCDNDERPEDGIVRNIEQRLKKAKRELERRDSVLARRELEKLVAKVERLWKRSEDDEERKHGKDRKNWWRRDKDDRVVITSEAYALLKYNTEYLIDRLPDRKPKKGSKDRD